MDKWCKVIIQLWSVDLGKSSCAFCENTWKQISVLYHDKKTKSSDICPPNGQ